MELQEGRLEAAEAVAWGTAPPGTSFFSNRVSCKSPLATCHSRAQWCCTAQVKICDEIDLPEMSNCLDRFMFSSKLFGQLPSITSVRGQMLRGPIRQ